MNLAQSFITESDDVEAEPGARRGAEVHALALEAARGPFYTAPVIVPRALFRAGSTQQRVYDRLVEIAPQNATPDEVHAHLNDEKLTRQQVAASLADLVSRALAAPSGPPRGRRYALKKQDEPLDEPADEEEEEL